MDIHQGEIKKSVDFRKSKPEMIYSRAGLLNLSITDMLD